MTTTPWKAESILALICIGVGFISALVLGYLKWFLKFYQLTLINPFYLVIMSFWWAVLLNLLYILPLNGVMTICNTVIILIQHAIMTIFLLILGDLITTIFYLKPNILRSRKRITKCLIILFAFILATVLTLSFNAFGSEKLLFKIFTKETSKGACEVSCIYNIAFITTLVLISIALISLMIGCLLLLKKQALDVKERICAYIKKRLIFTLTIMTFTAAPIILLFWVVSPIADNKQRKLVVTSIILLILQNICGIVLAGLLSLSCNDDEKDAYGLGNQNDLTDDESEHIRTKQTRGDGEIKSNAIVSSNDAKEGIFHDNKEPPTENKTITNIVPTNLNGNTSASLAPIPTLEMARNVSNSSNPIEGRLVEKKSSKNWLKARTLLKKNVVEDKMSDLEHDRDQSNGLQNNSQPHVKRGFTQNHATLRSTRSNQNIASFNLFDSNLKKSEILKVRETDMPQSMLQSSSGGNTRFGAVAELLMQNKKKQNKASKATLRKINEKTKKLEDTTTTKRPTAKHSSVSEALKMKTLHKNIQYTTKNIEITNKYVIDDGTSKTSTGSSDASDIHDEQNEDDDDYY